MQGYRACIKCGNGATDMHHLIVTKSMARGVSKLNKEFWKIVESDQNKYPLCNRCHTGSGHISRKEGKELLKLRFGSEKANDVFESVLSEAEKHIKVEFARIF